MRLEAGTTQLPDRANLSDVTGGESRRGHHPNKSMANEAPLLPPDERHFHRCVSGTLNLNTQEPSDIPVTDIRSVI